MIKFKKKLFFLIFISLFFSTKIFAELPYFIDVSKVLNSSIAGAGAQKALKTKFENDSSKFKKLETEIRKEETQLISQKKLISADEYKNKIDTLRKKVSNLQKGKQKSLKDLAKSRNDAKDKLLKTINPILKKYMVDKKIRIILDKKSVMLGDAGLEITDQIIEILNKELKSLKIN